MEVQFEFPSGKKVTIPIPEMGELATRDNRPRIQSIERTDAHKHACAHLGSPLRVETGCGSNARGVWSCEIYGQCRPLAPHPGAMSCPSCQFCTESYEPHADPGLLREIMSYGSALKRWIAAGRPTREPARIAELFTTCSMCPFRRMSKDGRQMWCGKCGCPLRPGANDPSTNKLAMATEACPLKPPKWEAEV